MVQYAKEQMQLWKSFFSKLDQKELHTAILSGLTTKLAVQMNHYVSEETLTFLDYLQLIDDHNKMSQEFETGGTGNFIDIGFNNEPDNNGQRQDDHEDEEEEEGEAAHADSAGTSEESAHQVELRQLKEKLALAQKEKDEALEKARVDEEIAKAEKAMADKAKLDKAKAEKTRQEAEKARLDAERELSRLSKTNAQTSS